MDCSCATLTVSLKSLYQICIDVLNDGTLWYSSETSLGLCKGKGHPAKGRGGPGFSWLQHYKGGRSSALHTDRLYSRRNPWYSFSGVELTPGHMVPSEPQKKSPATPPGIDPRTVWLVAQCLNNYATPSPLDLCNQINFDKSLHALHLLWVHGNRSDSHTFTHKVAMYWKTKYYCHLLGTQWKYESFYCRWCTCNTYASVHKSCYAQVNFYR